MKLKKGIIIGMIMALCSLTPAEALDVSAHSAILMDADTGQVLFEKAADERSLIASTTKIMTALVTLEQADLADEVEIPQEAVGIEGSSMYLRAGETVTVEDLLYGLMLSSGNDAAVALALHVSGSVEAFAEQMNCKARELSLENAHFANPNGLDSQENYATARDLAKLSSAAIKNEDFLRIVSTKSCQRAGRYLTNHNKLLWQYDGALGIKTGFTKKAGRILVGGARRNGRTLISVTINAPNDWQDHRKMLDLGFSEYQERLLVEKNQSLYEMPVISGASDMVRLQAEECISAYLLPGETPEIRICVPEFLYAPVESGQKVGTADYYVGELYLGTVALYTGQAVQILPEEKSLWEKILEKLGIDEMPVHRN